MTPSVQIVHKLAYNVHLINISFAYFQDDVRNWVIEKLQDQDGASSKDQELAETRHLVQVVQDACSMLTPIYTISSYFSRLSVDYYKTAALAVDSVVGSTTVYGLEISDGFVGIVLYCHTFWFMRS